MICINYPVSMKLSISNIAWLPEHDEEMYSFLREEKFAGLEIAPTRIFPDNPYEHIEEAKLFSARLLKEYGLSISSMQSIWFGRKENIFGTSDERKILTEYTKQAIDFAAAIECKNLVFGCPKNRNIPNGTSDTESVAIEFFAELANYAEKHGAIIAIEPNPTIYGTNFINTTPQAFELCKKLNINGFKVNLDIGTMIENKENIGVIRENITLINHIHISEPNLSPLEKRGLHTELYEVLRENNYGNFVSIEMKNSGDIELLKRIIQDVRKIFV